MKIARSFSNSIGSIADLPPSIPIELVIDTRGQVSKVSWTLGNCFLNGFLNMVDTLVFGGGICLIRLPIGTQSAHRHTRLAMSATMAMKAIVSAGDSATRLHSMRVAFSVPGPALWLPLSARCRSDHGLNLFGQRIARLSVRALVLADLDLLARVLH